MLLSKVRVAFVAWLLVLTSDGLSVMGSSSAFAGGPCLSSHCYSEANWTSVAIGVSATLHVTSAAAYDWSSDHFLDQELWAITNTGAVCPGGIECWAEVGITWRNISGNPSYTGPGPNWFWADYRPNGQYYEHYLSTLTNPSGLLGQNIPVGVAYTSTNTWTIYVFGFAVGTSTNNPGVAAGAQAGLEAYDSNSSDFVTSTYETYLRWMDYLGTWHDYWLGAGQYIAGSGMTGGYFTPNYVYVKGFT